MVPETTNSVEDTKDIVFLTNVGFQRHSSSVRAYFKSCWTTTLLLSQPSNLHIQISKFRNPRNLSRILTRTNDLEPIVHSQDIRTFFFHPSTYYVFRTITELIEILYIVFCFCHIILNTHSTSNKYMYIKIMCRQMIISSLIILFYKLCTLKKKNSNFHRMYFYLKRVLISIECTFI